MMQTIKKEQLVIRLHPNEYYRVNTNCSYSMTALECNNCRVYRRCNQSLLKLSNLCSNLKEKTICKWIDKTLAKKNLILMKKKVANRKSRKREKEAENQTSDYLLWISVYWLIRLSYLRTIKIKQFINKVHVQVIVSQGYHHSQ